VFNSSRRLPGVKADFGIPVDEAGLNGRHQERDICRHAAIMLRILLLAPGSHPDKTHGALIGYSHAEALARRHAVTLVIHNETEEAVRRKQPPFVAIEAINLPWLNRIYTWSIRWIFKNTYTSQALTAFSYPFGIVFEWCAWRRMRSRIMAGDFDVVLRLLPISAVLPSPFAYFLRRGPIPFVIGPINGGLPWPESFSQAKKEKELNAWLSGLRNLYRLLPFGRSTYRNAAAIIAGSSQTYAEFEAYRDKLFFVQGENGISASLCACALRSSPRSDKLELIFVGGLVPIKGVDLGLRAAAPLLRMDRARFTIVGDGPERTNLERLARSLGIEKVVSFCGMLRHGEAMKRLGASDVLVFPSIRDFGGAVVFEALAMGVVPVVVDFGGPGDIVRAEVGFKVPLTNEDDVVLRIGRVLADLDRDRDLLERLQQQGMRYARECLSWDAKAQNVSQILCWAVGRGSKPNLLPAKLLCPETC
jgi:glycosyltransferase involved in cell wall biosynthesis